jgi:hypothetical protein
MSFPHGYHRPLTPITPVHSPHPSASSIRSRTPGQLSLHEYRRQQVTPSPSAVPGQRSIKRKSAASSLRNYERIPLNPPIPELMSSHPFTSTPPLTPSLNAPTNLHLPLTHSRYASLATPPELAHSNSSDSDFSPPNSPPPNNITPSDPLLPAADFFPSTTPHLLHNFLAFPRKQSPSTTHRYQRPQGEDWDTGRRKRSVKFSLSQLQEIEPAESKSRTKAQYDTTQPGLESPGSGLLGPGLPGPGLPGSLSLQPGTKESFGSRLKERPVVTNSTENWGTEKQDSKLDGGSQSHER